MDEMILLLVGNEVGLIAESGLVDIDVELLWRARELSRVFSVRIAW